MSHVGLWSWKKGKKSSRYALLTLCWLMTLRKETGNARLNLSLTYYACPVKKTWPLLNYTHQKSLEEESSCRSSESTRQFPRLRWGNVSSLTFDKLFVWLKREKPPTHSESEECRDKFVKILMTTSLISYCMNRVSATTLEKHSLSTGYRLFNSSVLGQVELKKIWIESFHWPVNRKIGKMTNNTNKWPILIHCTN